MVILRGIGMVAAVIVILFIGLSVVAGLKKGASVYDDRPEEKNPNTGPADLSRRSGLYERRIKDVIDKLLAFFGLVVLSPVYVVIFLAIYLDDPGPVLFTQKRVGKNKEYFKLHKFRSMKLSTPHDTPTHLLEDPEQYITKVGKFLRKSSLDELPQIWDIFIGNMSIIGPRPALWNQVDLIMERDKYGANDIKPGLSGWAQINGRDELAITMKARLDGEYVEKESFVFDAKCFLATICSVLRHDGVVEGGTGTMEEKTEKVGSGK